MSSTDTFLEKYRQLEEAAEEKYGSSQSSSAVHALAKRPEYAAIRSEIDFCREVRNLLVHNPKLYGQSYAVEPTEELIRFLDEITEKVRHPMTAERMQVPRQKLLSARMSDKVRPVLYEMTQKGFSYVPILSDGRVKGVFSHSCTANMLLCGETAVNGEETTFGDIRKYLMIESDRPETFIFTAKDTPLHELREAFEKSKKLHRRLAMIFVTEHGSSTERITGFVTAWDVAAVQE